jgi:hypothetical protein
MNKKLMLIIIPVAALATFGGAFVAAYKTKPDVDVPPAVDLQAQQRELGLNASPTGGGMPMNGTASTATVDRAMTDQQLRDLVREVRERIRDYETKLQGLDAREQRMQTVQSDLRKDIDTLNTLRVDVAAAVAELKQQREVLEQTRIRIRDSERANLVTVAKTLENMEVDSAGQLVVNICKSAPTDPDVATEEVGERYAVKLLHLMDSKKRAKLMVALVGAEADLAGRLSMKLNRILETK